MPRDPFVTIENTFPLSGIDTSAAFHAQKPGTAVDGVNVRSFEPSTDRARGGSRPGLARFCPAQINGTNAIQDITAIVLPKSSFALPGSALAKGSVSGKVQLLADADGSASYTTGALGSNTNFGCFDGDRNGYVACIDGSNRIQLTKISTTTLAQIYQTTPFSIGSSAAVAGVAVFNDVCYVLVIVGSQPRVYRVDPADGSAIGSGPFIASGSVTSVVFSITTGAIGIALNDNNATGTILRQYDINTATLLATTQIQANGGGTSAPVAITADGGGNFFVNAGVSTASDDWTIRKVDASGAVLWTQNFTDPSSLGKGPFGLAYDGVNGRLGVVGNAINGTDSFQTRSASTGAKITGSQPNSAASWYAIAADGSGGFRISRFSTVSNVAKIASDLSLAWVASTGVISEWVASTSVLDQAGSDLMRSTRVQRALSVSGGLLAKFDQDGKTTIGSSFLSASASVVFSQPYGLYVYYLDGNSYKRYYAVDDTTSAWVATAGTLPSDTAGEICRLMCLYRGRIVLSGMRSDPQNIFMSAVNNPLDFDYSPVSQTPTQAIALNASRGLGIMGDAVTCLIPWSDDYLFVGCDHSIYLVSGDPASGGRIDLVTSVIGMAWGRPYCIGPDGTVFFFSSRGGVFYMTPGSQPQRLNSNISDELASVDVGTNIIRMAWDDRMQGIHLFITPIDDSIDHQHWTWESRTSAWWKVEYARVEHSPRAIWVYDGDSPDDRTVLIGGRDGYIRHYLNSATKDDGFAFTSSVTVGPFMTAKMGEVMLQEMQAELATASAPVQYAIYRGQTCEQALDSDPIDTGTWSPSRNFTDRLRWAGYAFYVKITSTDVWSIERFRLKARDLGMIRGRNR